VCARLGILKGIITFVKVLLERGRARGRRKLNDEKKKGGKWMVNGG